MNDPVPVHKRISPATYVFNAALIRLAKGMIRAWEEWVKTHQPLPEVELDPDPVKHFQKNT